MPFRWIERLSRCPAPLLASLSVAGAGAAGIPTRSDLVAALRQTAGNHTVSGQHAETGDKGPINAVHARTGERPGLVGGDCCHYEHKGPAIATFKSSPAACRNAGGLVLLTGRAVCMCEFGPGSPQLGHLNFPETTLVSAIRVKMPRTVLFGQRSDRNAVKVGWGIAATKDPADGLDDRWIINRDAVSYTGSPH